MTTMDLVEISRPLSYDAATGTYGTTETLVGLRVRHGGTVAAPRRTRSRTGVEHKAPGATHMALLRDAAKAPRWGTVATPGRREQNAARALEARGLGTTMRDPRIKARVVGFTINDRGRRAIADAG